MKTTTLGHTGIKTPILSFGAGSLGSIYYEVPQEQANKTVDVALEHGVNYFDVAPYYGLTKAETALGIALEGRKRSSFYIATKVGRYGDSLWDYSRDRTLRSVEESLKRLKIDYIDVIQCHDVEYGNHDEIVNEAIPALRELKEQGIVRNIGITGYKLDYLEKLAKECNVDTVMAYCTWSLQDRRLGESAKRLAKEGIGVINASPLSMGLLTSRGAPDWHPAHESVQDVCRNIAKFCKENGTDISEIALQFAIQTAADAGISTTVIGSANPDNMLKNIQILDKKMDEEFFAKIEEMMKPALNIGWDIRPGNGGKAGK